MLDAMFVVQIFSILALLSIVLLLVFNLNLFTLAKFSHVGESK